MLEKYIDRRLDTITAAIKQGYAQIYMPAIRQQPRDSVPRQDRARLAAGCEQTWGAKNLG